MSNLNGFKEWINEPIAIDASGKAILRIDCLGADEAEYFEECWRASRNSLTVDFTPVRQEADHHSFGGEEAVFQAAVKAIQLAGIKVKEK